MYLDLSGLAEQEAAKQVRALTLCFSRETVTVVENLGLTNEQWNDVKTVVKAIQRYVEGHLNESVERRMFHRRVQQPGECFDDFLVSLHEFSKTCNFCSADCMQKSVCDQIIEGLFDVNTIEQLLKESDLTLDKAISMCRAQKAAKKQRAEIHVRASLQRYIQSEDRVRLLSRLSSALVVAMAGTREVVSAAQHAIPHATLARILATSLGCVVEHEHYHLPFHHCTHQERELLH